MDEYTVCLWPGAGYVLYAFEVTAFNDEEALQHIKKYISNRPNQNGFFNYINSKNIDSQIILLSDLSTNISHISSIVYRNDENIENIEKEINLINQNINDILISNYKIFKKSS